jgi:hypothetical protein
MLAPLRLSRLTTKKLGLYLFDPSVSTFKEHFYFFRVARGKPEEDMAQRE